MDTRKEALRRILADAAPELADDDRRELLAHLDDAVEAGMRAGLSEDQAAARAVADLGDVKRIAADLGRARLKAVLRERSVNVVGFCIFAEVVLLIWTMAPGCARVFADMCLPMPQALAFFVQLGQAMRIGWPVVLLLSAGVAVLVFRRSPVRRVSGQVLAAASLVLLVAFAVAAGVPIMNWESLQQLPTVTPP